jgi:hypothetical protein
MPTDIGIIADTIDAANSCASITDSSEQISSATDKVLSPFAKTPSNISTSGESNEHAAESNERVLGDQQLSAVANSNQVTFKKRGRGRPPIHQQGDRRKARLKEVQ